jgi:hypothetical protein
VFIFLIYCALYVYLEYTNLCSIVVFEILNTVNTNIKIFCEVMPYSLVDRYEQFYYENEGSILL